VCLGFDWYLQSECVIVVNDVRLVDIEFILYGRRSAMSSKVFCLITVKI
jgi:hypothetical protein